MVRAWKAFEWRIATKWFGTRRTALSGMRDHDGDVEHGKLFVDCKLRKQLPFWKDWDKTQKQAAAVGKVPIMVIKQKRQKDRESMVICSLEFFKSIYNPNTPRPAEEGDEDDGLLVKAAATTTHGTE